MLDCLACPSFCCKWNGGVEVNASDIIRLARFLRLSEMEFIRLHVTQNPRDKELEIKSGDDTCMFLGADRRCTVYEARPAACRSYTCWTLDPHVFSLAKFVLHPPS